MPKLARPCLTLLLAGLVTSSAGAESAATEPVATTAHFAFFSDFETNLNDALVTAGRARARGATELFRAGAELECFAALPRAPQVGWDRAVDYYREIVSPHETADRAPLLIRLELAGVVKPDGWDDPGEARFTAIARGMRLAAAPAYRACRWQQQDSANRRWIAALAALLARHESAIAARLAEAFQTPWAGLPLRADVVETVDWSGGNTIPLRPPGAHVLISGSNAGYQGRAALEMIFHEACHFLTGRASPLRAALGEALRELDDPFRGDLGHAVHFYMTGEIVRRVLAEAGEPGYVPFLYAQGLYDRGSFRPAIESSWPRYLDGELALAEAARALVRALQAPPAAR